MGKYTCQSKEDGICRLPMGSCGQCENQHPIINWPLRLPTSNDSQCLRKINGGTECKELCDGCFEVWKLKKIGEGHESGIALLNAAQPELWNEVGVIIKNAIGLDPYRVAKIIDYLKDQFTIIKK